MKGDFYLWLIDKEIQKEISWMCRRYNAELLIGEPVCLADNNGTAIESLHRVGDLLVAEEILAYFDNVAPHLDPQIFQEVLPGSGVVESATLAIRARLCGEATEVDDMSLGDKRLMGIMHE